MPEGTAVQKCVHADATAVKSARTVGEITTAHGEVRTPAGIDPRLLKLEVLATIDTKAAILEQDHRVSSVVVAVPEATRLPSIRVRPTRRSGAESVGPPVRGLVKVAISHGEVQRASSWNEVRQRVGKEGIRNQIHRVAELAVSDRDIRRPLDTHLRLAEGQRVGKVRRTGEVKGTIFDDRRAVRTTGDAQHLVTLSRVRRLRLRPGL